MLISHNHNNFSIIPGAEQAYKDYYSLKLRKTLFSSLFLSLSFLMIFFPLVWGHDDAQ